MSDKLQARPKFNRTSGKWNVYIEHEGKEIPLGKQIDELFFKTNEYDSKQIATDFINSVEKFELKEK